MLPVVSHMHQAEKMVPLAADCLYMWQGRMLIKPLYLGSLLGACCSNGHVAII